MAKSIEEELEEIGVLSAPTSAFSLPPTVTLTEEDRTIIRQTTNEVRFKMKLIESAMGEVNSLLEALDQLVSLSPRVGTSTQEAPHGQEVSQES